MVLSSFMKLIFVRHGAKRNDDPDPALTSLGRKMAFSSGRWIEKHINSDPILISTPTIRTIQSANEICLALERELSILKQNIPSDWNSFERHVIDTYETYQNNLIILVGHHPTMEMLISKFSLPIPPQNFSSGVLLEKEHASWKCDHYWLGQTDL
jgi:phosphohistidine phosphatase SixA